jgi:hypothetical protein
MGLTGRVLGREELLLLLLLLLLSSTSIVVVAHSFFCHHYDITMTSLRSHDLLNLDLATTHERTSIYTVHDTQNLNYGASMPRTYPPVVSRIFSSRIWCLQQSIVLVLVLKGPANMA